MHTTTSPTTHNPARRIRTAIAAGAIGLLACGSLGACGASTPGAKSGKTTTTVAKKSTTTDAATKTDTTVRNTVPSGGGSNGAPNGGGQSGGNGGNPSGGNPSGGNNGGGGSNTAPAPTITGFTTPENIDCHNGNLQNFTLSWTTQNATKVTISIDGPGIYDTYGPNGDASLPFNCSSSHSFLLTAYGADGRTATKQVTLQPRNVQTPDPGDDAS